MIDTYSTTGKQHLHLTANTLDLCHGPKVVKSLPLDRIRSVTLTHGVNKTSVIGSILFWLLVAGLLIPVYGIGLLALIPLVRAVRLLWRGQSMLVVDGGTLTSRVIYTRIGEDPDLVAWTERLQKSVADKSQRLT